MKFDLSKLDIFGLFKKKEKVEKPDNYAVVKINDTAKESGIYDEFNKIIEWHYYGKIKKMKYTDADVESLRNQGVPVEEEDYTDEYEWLDVGSGGEVDYRK